MELLSPAGDLEKLKYAIYYGADAVYASGQKFGLRAKSKNLDWQELKTAQKFCRQHRRKLYITINIFPHNSDLTDLPEYLKYLGEIGVDAVIVSDPSVFTFCREIIPEIPIHISTQANVTSWKSAEFWFKLGARRIILARELTLHEIREIRERVPKLELEIFVHGAMCMAYSGRCLLSSFLNDRSANRGNCSQPCRWSYALVEESRPGESFQLSENEYGSYILNSKDLCLFDRLEEIKEAGIDSIKIEGRMKSVYYVANLTRIYKTALRCLTNKKVIPPSLKAELDKISHREYTIGFVDTPNPDNIHNYGSSSYIRNYQYIGPVIGQDKDYLLVPIKAKFTRGDELEIIFPDYDKDMKFTVNQILADDGTSIDFTKPNTTVMIQFNQKILEHGIIRKKKDEKM